MNLPQTGRMPPLIDKQLALLLKKAHPLDERDLFATDGYPEIRKLGRAALRMDGAARMDTYFAIGDLCASRALGVDNRLLIFYVGKTLNAYLRARSDAEDSVNRRLAERARAEFLAWVIYIAQTIPTRHNCAVALWGIAELGDTDAQTVAILEPAVVRLLVLYRRGSDASPAPPDSPKHGSTPQPMADLTPTDDGATMSGEDAISLHPEHLTEALKNTLVSLAGDPALLPEQFDGITIDERSFTPLDDGDTLGDSPDSAQLERMYGAFSAGGDSANWQGIQGKLQVSGEHFERILDSLENSTLADQSVAEFESIENDRARQIFNAPNLSLLTRAPEERDPLAADGTGGEYREGERIDGRYEVAAVLLGGMGVVYLCYDHDDREPIALKSFQNRFLQNERAVARFEQEALTWIRLEKHRYIVQAQLVQRIGSRPYIMLEHVSGPEGLGADLRSWIEQKKLTLPLAIEYGLHVALGMQHAMNQVQGLVHRDLKPANILVSHDGIAKVTDFGLVRSLDFEEITPMDLAVGRGRDERLTRMGAIIGTAPYLSPEQCRSNDVDMRSDIYAFGCMMYEMLTGHYVFQAKTLAAWIHAHLHERPAFDPALKKRLPPRLIALVLACLEKDPKDRPQTWGAIARELTTLYRDLTGGDPIIEVSGQVLAAHELMDKAYSLTELGRLDEALGAYDRALAMQPENAWAWARKGRALRLLRRYEDALACYDTSLKLEPRYAWAWKGRGMVLERMERLPEALDCHRAAAEIDPDDVWNWYNQAETLYRTGDTNGALTMLDQALKVEPQHAHSWGKRGQIYRAQKRYDDAIHAYRQAVDGDPSFAWAHNGCGLSLKAKGELQEAVLCFKRAVRYAPKESWYWYNLAETLVDLRRYEEALQPAQEAVRVDASHAFSWAKLGQIFRYLKRYKEALNAYNRSIGLQAENAWAHNGRGIVLERMERYSEALAAYQRAAELAPNDVWYWYNAGNVLCLLERYAEAADVLRHAISLNPDHANSWARLGSALHHLNQDEDARTALEKAVALEQDFGWAWGELGQVYETLGFKEEAASAYREAGDPAHNTENALLQQVDRLLDINQAGQAADLLQEALADEERSAPLWSKYGVVMRRMNRHDDALNAFTRAVELDPRQAWTHNGRGLALSALGRHDEALAEYQRAAELNDEDIWYRYNQGDALMALNRPHDAAIALEAAVRLDAKHAESWAKLGQAYRRLSRQQDAIHAYDQALALQPHYGWAWNGRGLALEDLKRREEALASYERALQEDDHIVWYHNNYIDLLLDVGRKADALAASERAVAALPNSAMAWARLGLAQRRNSLYAEAVESYQHAITLDSRYGWAWNGLGLAHNALNQFDDAADAFRSAITCDPDDVWFWRNLGDALMMLEDFSEAIITFERALALDPAHDSTRLKLKMAKEGLGE
jgi:tetratricopeptide (TPR) repeat protein